MANSTSLFQYISELLISVKEWPRSDIISFISMAAGLIAAIIAILTERSSRQRRKEEITGLVFFGEDTIENSKKTYIKPNYNDSDPSIHDEPFDSKLKEYPLFDYMDDFLLNGPEKRYLMLLSDTGMGKTSFLINYYINNRKKIKKKIKKKISLIPFGIPDFEDQIEKIKDRKNTILFLDAYDEDFQASKNPTDRLKDLMNKYYDFHKIVVTCRTQFFHKIDDIPNYTGFKLGPKGLGKGPKYNFHRVYLSFFSDIQIQTYLSNSFFLKKRIQKKAYNLVKKIPYLSMRPMLLSYIPELIDNLDLNIRYTFQIYEVMVTNWIKREFDSAQEQNALLEFSEQLAFDLYNKRAQRGAERISISELTDLSEKWKIELESCELTSRSLLNRDNAGNYKFAHRSIMEYLYVIHFLKSNPNERIKIQWSAQMKSFFLEIIRYKYIEKTNSTKGLDFSLVDLSEMDMESMQFNSVSFEHANLKGVNFKKADLTNANLSSANLKDSNLSASILINVDLDKASLIGAKFDSTIISNANLEEANLVGANIQMAHLRKSSLNGVNLANSNLCNINLKGISLNKANLSGANLTKTNLTDASFREANLSNTDLSFAKMINTSFRYANLESAYLCESKILNVRFDNAIFKNSTIKKVSLIESSFKNSHFTGVKIANSKTVLCALNGSVFNDTDIHFADFVTTNFEKTTFNKVVFDNTNFHDCSLYETQNDIMKFKKCFFKKTKFNDSKYKGAILNECNFERCEIKNAGWTESSFSICVFSNSNLNTSCFDHNNFSLFKASNSDFSKTVFKKCQISELLVKECNLTGATFDESEIFDGDLKWVSAKHISIIDSKIFTTDLRGAKFNWADINRSEFDAIKGFALDLRGSRIDNSNIEVFKELDKNNTISKSVKELESIQECIEKADYHISQKEFELAVTILEKALEFDSKNITALIKLNLTLGDLNRHEEAVKVANRILKISPASKTALVNKCYSLNCLQKYREALSSIDSAINIDGMDEIMGLNKVISLLRLENYHKALKVTYTILEKNPTNEWAWTYGGYAEYHRGNYQKAYNSVEKAIECGGSNLKLLMLKKKILKSLGEFEYGDFLDSRIETTKQSTKLSTHLEGI